MKNEEDPSYPEYMWPTHPWAAGISSERAPDFPDAFVEGIRKEVECDPRPGHDHHEEDIHQYDPRHQVAHYGTDTQHRRKNCTKLGKKKSP